MSNAGILTRAAANGAYLLVLSVSLIASIIIGVRGVMWALGPLFPNTAPWDGALLLLGFIPFVVTAGFWMAYIGGNLNE